jgi:hypothetical protein
MNRREQTWIFVVIILGLIAWVVWCSFIPKPSALDQFEISTGTVFSGNIERTLTTDTAEECAGLTLDMKALGFTWQKTGECQVLSYVSDNPINDGLGEGIVAGALKKK